MQRQTDLVRLRTFGIDSTRVAEPDTAPKNLKSPRIPPVEEARLASLKVLAMTLLSQVESLEAQFVTDQSPQLNLQKEVQRFEAAIIRSALWKTGGRQRRAARLLGVKVTTLNTKIKRHKIKIDDSTRSVAEPAETANEVLPRS